MNERDNNKFNTFAAKETIHEKLTLERTFSTEPRLRIRRGHTITIRRCYEIAKHLYQCGFRDAATREDLNNAVFYCAGGDYRTANRYVGRWLFTKPTIKEGVIVEPARRIKYLKGYLERLHFIEPLREGLFSLCFGVLPFDVSKCESSSTITVLCAHGVGGEGQLQQTTNDSTTTTHNTHTNQSSESNLIDAILSAKPYEFDKPLPKIAWPSQPFKPQYEEREKLSSPDSYDRMDEHLARLRKAGAEQP